MLRGIIVGLVILLVVGSVQAQSPFGINYQGVAREADGTPISDQAIGLRISITNGPNGQVAYSEEHAVRTNDFGLFSVVIGQGTSSDNLQDVDWSTGNKWLEIELDAKGDGSFQLIGNQQMLSVPYALFSLESADQLNAGSGIAIVGDQIINTSPDQPVTIQGTGNITTSGTYPNFNVDGTGLATTTYVDNSTGSIQTAVDANTAALAAEIANRTAADNGIQAELDATQSGAGLETDGTYLPNASTTYLGGAADLKNADETLDVAIAQNAADIVSLNADLNATYAFKNTVNFANTTGADYNGPIDFSISFAQDPSTLVGSEFIAPVDGYYQINVSIAIDATLSDIYISAAGVLDQLYKTQATDLTNIIHRKSSIYQLQAGESIYIEVRNLQNGRVVVGEFSGYKL